MEKNPFKYTLDNKRYHTLNYYNRTNFGGKIYKASLNCGFTCPNLDGSRGTGGCIFCDGGSGYFTAPQLTAVQQLNSEIARLHKKFGTDMPVIAYFQANTNPYAPVEQLRELYTKYYREATGKEPEIGEADPLNLLMKAFCAMEYQTMQYADAKGRMEMLKTSTGDALDALAALVGLTRKEANRATATVRFTLSEAQSGATAIPTGTRVKSEDGKYFNTVEYGEIAAGETYTDVVVQAERPERTATAFCPAASRYWLTPSPMLPA